MTTTNNVVGVKSVNKEVTKVTKTAKAPKPVHVQRYGGRGFSLDWEDDDVQSSLSQFQQTEVVKG